MLAADLSRQQLAREQARRNRTVDEWVGAPLGTLGNVMADPLMELARRQEALRPNSAGALRNTAGIARVLPRVIGYGVPALMAAGSGYEQGGVGGAGINLIGAALGAPFGPLGAIAGSFAGDLVTRGAVGAVNSAQGGEGGLIGAIGNALDPIIQTPYEREQQRVMQELNSPAMRQLKAEEDRRKAEARRDAMFGLLVQSQVS